MVIILKKIVLENFVLEEIDITKKEHLEIIKIFDNDSLVKKYLYPYKDSFYDLVTDSIKTDDIFNTFYIIYTNNTPIGYMEIEKPNKTFLNSALIPTERRKGYSTQLLKELSSYLLKNYSNVNSVNTIIRKTNESSIGTVLKAGLTKVEEDTNFVTYGKTR